MFGKYLSEKLDQKYALKLYQSYLHYVQYEPEFTENIYLKEPLNVLMERIAKRNRPGEKTLTQEYITDL